jgi:phage N-6-adenine-methyltransferase
MIKQMKMQQSTVDDDFWTPIELYERLCKLYDINPELDVAANSMNTKCDQYLTNALFEEWITNTTRNIIIVDVWCNPPHSLTEEFIRRADSQHKKYNMNIMMIVPSNTESTKVWSEIIEDDYKDLVENHRVESRLRFLQHGNTKTKFSSRNAYRVLIWRKK